MLRLTLSLFVIFVWTVCKIVVIKKQNDKIYSGHVLYQVSMPMWSICAQFCSRVKMCKSINFIAWNRTCQINDAESKGCNDELLKSVGNSFVAASTFPEALAGQCKGHDCKLNEVCMPKEMTYSCFPLLSQLSKRIFKQIFVACSGNQQSVLDTWRNPSLGGDIDNITKSRTNQHLRSSMIDYWDESNIDQVKVELYRKGTLDVEIYFDGRGSTNSDWFTKERLLSSSFNDLNQMSTLNFFSVDGMRNQARHFYISNLHRGCSKDAGWIVVIDKVDGVTRFCMYDKIPGKAYPYILYGTNHHKIKFETEAAVADMMIISVSTLV